MSKKKILIYIGSPLLSLVILTATAFAINSIAEGYRVLTNTTGTKVTSSSGCQTVTNSGSSDIFVPTKTATEWNSFLANKPSYITMGDCITLPAAPIGFKADTVNFVVYSNAYQETGPYVGAVSLLWSIPVDSPNAYNHSVDTNLGYNLYRSNGLNGTYSKLNNTLISSLPSGSSVSYGKNVSLYNNSFVYFYVDSPVSNSTTYYYKISAVNSYGEGPQSSAISIKTLTPILNSFSGQTCVQKCSAASLSCVGVGTDIGSSNLQVSYDESFNQTGGSSCKSSSAQGMPGSVHYGCNMVMENTSQRGGICQGIKTLWTTCACK